MQTIIQLFYSFTLVVIFYEIFKLFDPGRTKRTNEVNKLLKEYRDDKVAIKLLYQGSWEVRNFIFHVTFNILYLVWNVIGLFSSQWFYFFLLLVQALLIYYFSRKNNSFFITIIDVCTTVSILTIMLHDKGFLI